MVGAVVRRMKAAFSVKPVNGRYDVMVIRRNGKFALPA